MLPRDRTPCELGVMRWQQQEEKLEDGVQAVEQGAWGTLTVPSASAEITFPRADSDLLIFFASSNTAPSAPVLLTYPRSKE